MQLTQEYLDQALSKLSTKDDLQLLTADTDLKFADIKQDLKFLATKEELKSLASKDDLSIWLPKRSWRLSLQNQTLIHLPQRQSYS